MEDLGLGDKLNKVMVTGATGSIGRELVALLSAAGVETVAIVRENDPGVAAIASLPGVRIVVCEMDDVGKLPDLVLDRDLQVCIHLAWEGSTGADRADYDLQIKNVSRTLDLVGALASMKVGRFVGAGSLAELDVLAYTPTDGATPNAVSHYGSAKLMAHFMSKAECARQGIEHVWCRLANSYGAGSTTNNFVLMASRTMLEGRRAAFTTGEQTYDFMYVSDTARALCACAAKGRPGVAYYLGSGSPRQLREYIVAIRDAVDPAIELHLGEIPFNGRSLPKEAYDAEKLYHDTGFSAHVTFEEGIVRTVAWLREAAVQ
ncbi:MAG: NAD(P)-dependent oxidoreductase [Coriobacteriales bacterium]|nr:NAD(P)-dependent oxidoreductase [Coriobacteriales bacterium]